MSRHLTHSIDVGAIYVVIDYGCAPNQSYPKMLVICERVIAHVREQCENGWKKDWGTSERNISLSGSSS